MNTLSPKLIAVEGPDGSGKSTVIKYLADRLNALNLPTVSTYEVGGTPIGKQLRNICFTKREDETLDPVARLLLVYAARIQHINEVITPALDKAFNVVTDRFNISTMVYQGIIDKQALLMGKIESDLITTLPDVIFFLNVNPEIALSRRTQRGNVDNDYYKDNIDKTQRIHNAYRTVITILDHNDLYKPIPIITIDANQDEANVKQQIDLAINKVFNLEDVRAELQEDFLEIAESIDNPPEIVVVSITTNPYYLYF